jgi:hypothetical protein
MTTPKPYTPEWFATGAGGTDPVGYFSFTRSITPPNIETDAGDRCDRYRQHGPAGWHDWNETTGECSCGSTDKPDLLTCSHQIEWGNFEIMLPVITAPQVGYILWFENKDRSLELGTTEAPYTAMTRTLQEMFRLLVEWDYAHTELDNHESFAVTAHNFLKAVGISDSLRTWLIESVPPERVGRYLEGHPNARARTTLPIPELSLNGGLEEDFYYWVTDLIADAKDIGSYD